MNQSTTQRKASAFQGWIEHEVVGQMELVLAGAVVPGQPLQVEQVDLADGHAVVVAVEGAPEAAHDLVDLGPVLVVAGHRHQLGPAPGPGLAALVEVGLVEVDQGVVRSSGSRAILWATSTEAVDAPVEPGTLTSSMASLTSGFHQLRVRLLGREGVQVPLPGGLVEGPGPAGARGRR